MKLGAGKQAQWNLVKKLKFWIHISSLLLSFVTLLTLERPKDSSVHSKQSLIPVDRVLPLELYLARHTTSSLLRWRWNHRRRVAYYKVLGFPLLALIILRDPMRVDMYEVSIVWLIAVAFSTLARLLVGPLFGPSFGKARNERPCFLLCETSLSSWIRWEGLTVLIHCALPPRLVTSEWSKHSPTEIYWISLWAFLDP